MASKIYPAGLVKVLQQPYDMETSASMLCQLTNSTQTYSNAHDYQDDVTGNKIAGTTDQALTAATLSVSGSVLKLDATDPTTWTSVASGTIGSVILYYNSGSSATSPLIAFLDVTDTVANGGNIVVNWHASGIFTIDCT